MPSSGSDEVTSHVLETWLWNCGKRYFRVNTWFISFKSINNIILVEVWQSVLETSALYWQHLIWKINIDLTLLQFDTFFKYRSTENLSWSTRALLMNSFENCEVEPLQIFTKFHSWSVKLGIFNYISYFQEVNFFRGNKSGDNLQLPKVLQNCVSVRGVSLPSVQERERMFWTWIRKNK